MSVVQPDYGWEEHEGGIIICGTGPDRCQHEEGGGDVVMEYEPPEREPFPQRCKGRIAAYCDQVVGSEFSGELCGLAACSEHSVEVDWGRHRCWQHMEQETA